MRTAPASFGFIAALCILTSPVMAQEAISDCDWPASLRNIVEPWESHTRTFANGKIRIAHVDTGGEPVCCSSYLAILAPTGSEVELESRQCKLLTDGVEMSGFNWIAFDSITASYDPGLGLLLSVPVERFDFAGDGTTIPATVGIRINQATGEIYTE